MSLFYFVQVNSRLFKMQKKTIPSLRGQQHSADFKYIKLNQILDTYVPPSFGRSVDLPMTRYDLPSFNPKWSLQLGRAKNGLTLPSTSSSVPTGQNNV